MRQSSPERCLKEIEATNVSYCLTALVFEYFARIDQQDAGPLVHSMRYDLHPRLAMGWAVAACTTLGRAQKLVETGMMGKSLRGAMANIFEMDSKS